MRAAVNLNPAAMKPPTDTTWIYKLEGNSLTMTQKTNQAGPTANPITLKLTRVE